jgi:hypothetical protein
VPTWLLVARDLTQVLDDLAPGGRVVQQLPPRLAVVEAGASTVEELRGHPAVLAIGDPDLPPDVLAGLTESERLFVDAWVVGRRAKSRRGDGLAWDAPGFTPPDPPPSGGPGR